MLPSEPVDHQAPPGTSLVQVVAAVVQRDGRFLLALRSEGKRHAGLWEFPGGKLLPGESHLEAARRELREELGLEVEAIGPPTATFRDPGSPFVIDFVPVIAHGEPEPTEHQAVRWVALAQLADLPLAPADQQFLSWLLQPPP